MDIKSTVANIRKPIEKEFEDYLEYFNSTLMHDEEPQKTLFEQIKNQGGKRLRPTLLLLLAKAVGNVSKNTLKAATAIELLHTASLIHDDVVDDSDKRRGQVSINSKNGNKFAVLIGDYILSTALLTIASTGDKDLVAILSRIGQTLADGEILQMKKDTNIDFRYETYYKIIEKKTASLFMACCEAGVLTAENKQKDCSETVADAIKFGKLIGLIFQIRDDIFDYLPTKEVGKPTAKDMKEGKLTLPALYFLNVSHEKNDCNPHEFEEKELENLHAWAQKVKHGSITDDEISAFIEYVVKHGGVEFAEQKMQELAAEAHRLADKITEKQDIRNSLHTIVEYFAGRDQ